MSNLPSLSTWFIILITLLILSAVIALLRWSRSALASDQRTLELWRALCSSCRDATRSGSPLDRERAPDLECWRWLKSVVIERSNSTLNMSYGHSHQSALADPQVITLVDDPLIIVTSLPSPEELIPEPSHRLLVIPAICSMLGVIGTFLGIQHGLSSSQMGVALDPSAGSDRVDELTRGAGLLFESMGVAFITSLAGLGFALVTTLMISRVHTHKRRVRALIVAELHQTFYHVSPSRITLELLSAIQRLKPSGVDSSQIEGQAELPTSQGVTRADQQLMVAEIVAQLEEVMDERLGDLK